MYISFSDYQYSKHPKNNNISKNNHPIIIKQNLLAKNAADIETLDKPYRKSREVAKEREEDKRRILEENPHIPKDALEFMLSLLVE
jgi:hypothetical protein